MIGRLTVNLILRTSASTLFITSRVGPAAISVLVKATLNCNVVFDLEKATVSYLEALTLENWRPEFKCGVPFLAEGKIKVSASSSFTTEWGGSETKSTSSVPSATVKDIPPGGSTRITFYATKGKATVPFKYVQIDVYSDGSVSPPRVLDKGVNNFDFNYVVTDTRDRNGVLMDLPNKLGLPAKESIPVEE
ncbi:hypothetical protein BGZ83_004605 [Gryganskiella cystojenkinii]|nr:hypothetical protein BGZ83_004605 [Gryganskiella cystojenkinii]